MTFNAPHLIIWDGALVAEFTDGAKGVQALYDALVAARLWKARSSLLLYTPKIAYQIDRSALQPNIPSASVSSEELKKSEVLQQVKELVDEGKLRWAGHAEERLVERNITRQEVAQGLLNSRDFHEPPYTETRNGRTVYKFTILAQTDTIRIGVVASLDPQTKVVVVSTWDVKTKGWK